MIRFKTMIVKVTTAVLFFTAVCSLYAMPGISLKLSGGLGNYRVGDTNDNISDLIRNWENVAGLRHEGLPSTLEKLSSGREGEIEVIVRIRSGFAVSLGLGSISIEKNDNRMEMALPPPIRHQVQTEDNRITAMPVTVNLYYFKPVFKSGNLFIKAGGGYFSVQWWEKGRYEEETAEIPFYWREWELDAKANGLGVQGSIGFEVRLIGRLSVSAEAYGRFCKISGFKGDGSVRRSYNPQSSSYPDGTLYYYEWYDAMTSDWYADINLRTDTPGGETERNVRKAEVDLSGVGVRLGVSVRLW